ncbi:uncharacterized protein LOC131678816 [Topomyia yanbarensis]|uniref:uncharacterized protein LOC131678816 n=1 Tax=Topomyia yanbarensis TaxID=2498891 RepID=UPI00273B1986|nr:uncharacterized protein LOC131678816 [Topomyia yanbarensis]
MVQIVRLAGNSRCLSGKVIAFLLLAIVGVAFACNGGYKLKVRKVQNCAGSDAVITASENYTVVLTKNCDIKSRGCVQFKSFKTAVAKYKIRKDGVQILQGNMNLCDTIKTGSRHADVGPIMRTFKLPEKCPVEEGSLCTDPTQVVNIAPFAQFLTLVRGTIDVETEIQHDTGRSCFQVRFDVTK